MNVDSSKFAEDLTDVCHSHYENHLVKTGKPQPEKEWTHLSAIVIFFSKDERYEVVSMATGTSCLSARQLKDLKNGSSLRDSHAEILARRCFIRYLISELRSVATGQISPVVSIFQCETGNRKFHINDGVSFHFYSSHIFCGDAAIFPKDNEQSHQTTSPPPEDTCEQHISNMSFSNDKPPSKKRRNARHIPSHFPENDINRTGAKCVPGEIMDTFGIGANYHVTGVLRTKPGRGDRTASMSCSDKLARWNVVGIQGALLTNILDSPIYLESVVLSTSHFSFRAFQRAAYLRLANIKNLPPSYKLNKPKILHCNKNFKHGKRENDIRPPCPTAIIWFKEGSLSRQEVSVKGFKLGVTKKNKNTSSSRLSICSYEIFKEYISLISRLYNDKDDNSDKSMMITSQNSLRTYLDHKLNAKDYQFASQCFHDTLPGWIRSPKSCYDFIIS